MTFCWLEKLSEMLQVFKQALPYVAVKTTEKLSQSFRQVKEYTDEQMPSRIENCIHICSLRTPTMIFPNQFPQLVFIHLHHHPLHNWSLKLVQFYIVFFFLQIKVEGSSKEEFDVLHNRLMIDFVHKV